MSKQLFKALIIFDDRILSVAVEEISRHGADGRIFQIDIIDENGKHIEKERKTVEVSGTFLAANVMHEDDLLSYLIQFRKKLPKTITTNTKDVFKHPDWPRNKKLHETGKLIQVYFRERAEDALYPDTIRNSVEIEFFEIISIFEYFEKNEIVTGVELGSEAVKVIKGWEQRLMPILEDLGKEVKSETESTYKLKASTGEFNLTGGDAKLTVNKKCQELIMYDADCPRDAVDGKKCILHSEDDKKDISSFEDLIINAITMKNHTIDFSGFVFPEKYQFTKFLDFKESLILNKTVFNGFVDLSNRKFEKDVKILNCVFRGGVKFTNAEFIGDVEISILDTPNCSFEGCYFRKGLVFDKINPNPGMLASVDFKDATFSEPNSVSFKRTFFPQLVLQDCNVSEIKIYHIMGSEEEFKGVVSRTGAQKTSSFFYRLWGCFSKRAIWKRDLSYVEDDEFDGNLAFKLGDEFRLADSLRKKMAQRLTKAKMRRIIECYQRLQIVLIRDKNYYAAGKLHRREMELERLKYRWWGRLFSFYAWYRWLASYCESIWKPIVVLGLILSVAPIIIMLTMGENNFDITGNLVDLPDSIVDWKDEARDNINRVINNMSTVYDYKKNASKDWDFFFLFERLLLLLQVSFIVVAFRRKFRKY